MALRQEEAYATLFSPPGQTKNNPCRVNWVDMQVHKHIFPYLLSCDLSSKTLLTFVLAQSTERAVESKQFVPSESDYS